jgi:Spy/CpxP family protein refolding chaperone
MKTKIVSAAVAAGMLFAVAAPVAYAADAPAAPKTKSECSKVKDMKWDDKTSACVKK